MLIFACLLTGVLIINGLTMQGLEWAFGHPRFVDQRFAPPAKRRMDAATRRRLNAVNSVLSVIILYAALLGLYPLLFTDAAVPLWKAAVQVVGVLAVYDLLYYGLHRLMHHRKLMRFVHRVHHLARNPSAVDSLWVHPVELVAGLVVLLMSTGLVALGGPIHIGAFAVAFLVYSEMNLFIHSGLRFRGPLAVFNGVTESHFAHHHVDVNRNFASLSPIWDAVFGTRHRAS